MGVLTDEMKRFVSEQRLGFFATVCADGTPNLSPKGTIAVWDDDHLVFIEVCSPGTIANLRRNPAIEVNVVDPFVRKGCRAKGTAEILEEGPLFERIVRFYRERGTTRVIERGVLITVERADLLISPAYDTGLSEEEVRARWKTHYGSLNK